MRLTSAQSLTCMRTHTENVTGRNNTQNDSPDKVEWFNSLCVQIKGGRWVMITIAEVLVTDLLFC